MRSVLEQLCWQLVAVEPYLVRLGAVPLWWKAEVWHCTPALDAGVSANMCMHLLCISRW